MLLRSCLLLVFLAAAPLCAAEPEKPKLLVLVVFDQMRGDYLKRWQSIVRRRWLRAPAKRRRLVYELPLPLCDNADRARPRLDVDRLRPCAARHRCEPVVRPQDRRGGQLQLNRLAISASPPCPRSTSTKRQRTRRTRKRSKKSWPVRPIICWRRRLGDALKEATRRQGESGRPVLQGSLRAASRRQGRGRGLLARQRRRHDRHLVLLSR